MSEVEQVPVGVPKGLLAPKIVKGGKPKPKPVVPEPDVDGAPSATVATVNGLPVIMASIPMGLAARLLTDVKGEGGWQNIWRAVKQGVVVDADAQTATVVIPKAVAAKVLSYAVNYGGGGYQSAFRHLVCCLVKAGWSL